MNRPWSAEQVVSESLACSLIEAQFPALAPVRVEPLGVGWDNTAYRVNGEFVFRFPRRQVAVELLATEQRVLPAIAPRLPLAVPVPTMFGEAGDQFCWPFSGYSMLPGRPACMAVLTPHQRENSAESLARFLATLHAINASEAARLGAQPDNIGRLDLSKRVPKTRTNLEELVQSGVIDEWTPWLPILDEMDLSRPAKSTSLVHGDLYARHLLVDGDALVCGVIDWGDVHIGDPAVDLSIAHSFLPPEAHGAFRRAYGRVDEDTWRVARFRALCHASVTIPYGRSIGDDDLVGEGLIALRHLAVDLESAD
jgi:aminoglycoside phosphotransferase (APT) family kinase protein